MPAFVVGTLALSVVVAGLAMDLSGSVPSIRRQVNEDWLNAYRGWVYGGGFGFQLGVGLDVIVTTAAVYAMFAFTFLAATPAAGLAIGMTFGAVRGLAILTAARVTTPQLLRGFHRRLQSFLPAARRLVLATEACAVVVLAVVLVVGR